ncbi:hypothetical protein Sango_2748600 [Sesamum angolense]|uniref:Retrotransposon Copia-like N-terminal domain-containing protein n=1 Tax=Sesamum angolense TaxID=2727404 RepID=A0AAE1T7P3_9LAMI|nr:hypothetical protein Sango_2748600 [Sesamum angolense]
MAMRCLALTVIKPKFSDISNSRGCIPSRSSCRACKVAKLLSLRLKVSDPASTDCISNCLLGLQWRLKQQKEVLLDRHLSFSMDRKFYNFSAQTIKEWYSYPRHLTVRIFLAWSRVVKRVLGAKMKFGFITGTYKKPSGDPELIEQWTRVDGMVASWLLNAMTKNLSNGFIYAKSTRTVWIALNEQYEVTKDNTTSVSDMVMELVRVPKQIPHDPIQANHTGEYAGPFD